MNIYYEMQRGGLCRLHSLNAFFGKAFINDQKFSEYKNDYDNYMLYKFNVPKECSCNNYDIINSDQNTLVSYILKRNGFYTRYYAINELFKFPGGLETQITKIGGISNIINKFIFVFNEGHIWGIKYCDISKKWYKVDSMGGISNCNISSLCNTKNIGFIIPIDQKLEFYRNMGIIKDIFIDISLDISLDIYNDDDKSKIINMDKHIKYIQNYLIDLHSKKLILGDLEIPLTICTEILEILLIRIKSDIDVNKFDEVKKLIKKYNEFLNQFTNGRYTDLDLILEYLPDILYQLLNLGRFT